MNGRRPKHATLPKAKKVSRTKVHKLNMSFFGIQRGERLIQLGLLDIYS